MKARVYRWKFQLAGEMNWHEETYPFRINAVLNRWVKIHLERLDIVAERFILEEIEL